MAFYHHPVARTRHEPLPGTGDLLGGIRYARARSRLGWKQDEEARAHAGEPVGIEEPLRRGCVVVLEEARIRIRLLPVGGAV